MTDSNEDFLSMIEQIQEFVTLSEFIDDSEVDKALGIVLKLIAKPDVPPSKVGPLIVQLAALSAKFHTLAGFYKTIGAKRSGTPEAHKKNMYYNLVASINELVAALKYLTRPPQG